MHLHDDGVRPACTWERLSIWKLTMRARTKEISKCSKSTAASKPVGVHSQSHNSECMFLNDVKWRLCCVLMLPVSNSWVTSADASVKNQDISRCVTLSITSRCTLCYERSWLLCSNTLTCLCLDEGFFCLQNHCSNLWSMNTAQLQRCM